MSTINWCRGRYNGSGGSQGGSRRSSNNYGKCLDCGKLVKITRAGYLWAHGTKRQEQEKQS